MLEEDTIDVVRTMRASSPPASAADLLEAQTQNQKRNNKQLRRVIYRFIIETERHGSELVVR